MAALYSNENFPLPAVLELRLLGHDVLTIQETGRADQALPDEAVLAFAAEQQRILITLNRRHFILLHNAGRPHAGIIACTFDPDFVALARRVHEAIAKEPDMRQTDAGQPGVIPPHYPKAATRLSFIPAMHAGFFRHTATLPHRSTPGMTCQRPPPARVLSCCRQ